MHLAKKADFVTRNKRPNPQNMEFHPYRRKYLSFDQMSTPNPDCRARPPIVINWAFQSESAEKLKNGFKIGNKSISHNHPRPSTYLFRNLETLDSRSCTLLHVKSWTHFRSKMRTGCPRIFGRSKIIKGSFTTILVHTECN